MNDEIKDKIITIIDTFGMTGSKVAEAMNVSYATFRNKKNENNPSHTFNEKNYLDLVKFIKHKANELP
jgi:hypothetical protein